MSKKITPEQVFELSKSFHQLASTLGDYRYDHWDELTKSKRGQLEKMQWTLLNTSSDLNAKAVVMKTKLLAEELETLKTVSTGMRKAVKKIKNIKHAIEIGVKAVAFGGAISTGNVPVTIAAGKELLSEINI